MSNRLYGVKTVVGLWYTGGHEQHWIANDTRASAYTYTEARIQADYLNSKLHGISPCYAARLPVYEESTVVLH
jgi:hypothetical protein